jgi:hypothetical protein
MVRGKAGLAVGAALLALSCFVLFMDMLSTGVFLASMALVTFAMSVMTGRNIAFLMHDSAVLKRRSGREFSPKGLISIWMLLFITAVLIYTVTSTVFFKSIALAIAGLTFSFLGLIHSTSALVGSYLIFRYHSDRHPDRFYSSWGRRMEKMAGMRKALMDRGMEMFTRPFQ